MEFRDPWGNRVQIVVYANIQFTKHKAILDGIGSADLQIALKLSRNLPEREWRSKRTESFFVAIGCCSANAGIFGVRFACGAAIRSGDSMAP